MKRYDLLIIGAGPAGLSAAVEGASYGMKVGVFDENAQPGGQLFKQIHKFFGAKEHQAKIRGFNIGGQLLSQAESLGVDVHLNTVVMGLYPYLSVKVSNGEKLYAYSGDSIIVAAGASENMLPFEGWTLPGVMGAGAAQTLMNLHGIKPGRRILMVGSGNVGLVVSYQLLQAGCDVVAIIDAAPRVGGYGVHASKVSRTGVPFYLSHCIVKAEGTDMVTGAVIAEVDKDWNIIPDTEKHIDTDTVCIAAGLSPMSQLTGMVGCKMADNGGAVPVVNEYMETSIEGLFAAGDVTGIEEASQAMIGGRIAAASAAKRSGYLEEEDFLKVYKELRASLDQLRGGMFSHENKGRTDLVSTDEGFPLSQTLLSRGYISDEEIESFAASGINQVTGGFHPVIECTQNIPCDPCQDACPSGCITVGDAITNIPLIKNSVICSNCGLCVSSCPGLAIFLVNEEFEPGYAAVTLPYEFFPLPEVGATGKALDRSGKVVCDAEVADVKSAKAFDRTVLLTIKIPASAVKSARFFKTCREVEECTT